MREGHPWDPAADTLRNRAGSPGQLPHTHSSREETMKAKIATWVSTLTVIAAHQQKKECER
jgi:hypothetical protein